MWASGTGADVMRRIAAPMLGGLFTSFLMELLIYPVIFYIAKGRSLRHSIDPVGSVIGEANLGVGEVSHV